MKLFIILLPLLTYSLCTKLLNKNEISKNINQGVAPLDSVIIASQAENITSFRKSLDEIDQRIDAEIETLATGVASLYGVYKEYNVKEANAERNFLIGQLSQIREKLNNITKKFDDLQIILSWKSVSLNFNKMKTFIDLREAFQEIARSPTIGRVENFLMYCDDLQISSPTSVNFQITGKESIFENAKKTHNRMDLLNLGKFVLLFFSEAATLNVLCNAARNYQNETIVISATTMKNWILHDKLNEFFSGFKAVDDSINSEIASREFPLEFAKNNTGLNHKDFAQKLRNELQQYYPSKQWIVGSYSSNYFQNADNYHLVHAKRNIQYIFNQYGRTFFVGSTNASDISVNASLSRFAYEIDIYKISFCAITVDKLKLAYPGKSIVCVAKNDFNVPEPYFAHSNSILVDDVCFRYFYSDPTTKKLHQFSIFSPCSVRSFERYPSQAGVAWEFEVAIF